MSDPSEIRLRVIGKHKILETLSEALIKSVLNYPQQAFIPKVFRLKAYGMVRDFTR